MRELIRHALEKHEWKVVEASDGVEGLAQVDRAVPRVVLLDLNMPVMDGFAPTAAVLADYLVSLKRTLNSATSFFQRDAVLLQKVVACPPSQTHIKL